MRTITYPDGSTYTTSALAIKDVESIWQDTVIQLLGFIVSPLTVGLTLTQNSNQATADSITLLLPNQVISATGVPSGTVIALIGPGNLIIMSNEATASGSVQAQITDPNSYGKVRIGWLTQGQPGIQVTDDVIFLRCETYDSEFSRLRDSVESDEDLPVINWNDVHTRTWKVLITAYGPNSLINGKLIVGGLLNVPFFDTYLSGFNLYVNPSIEQPRRIPQDFQAEWWERVDISVEFNEQVTETFTVGTVETVVVTTYDKTGQLTTQTITA